MAAPEQLSCTFHEQDPLPAPRRTSDDLPSHVKGIVRWYPDAEPIAGYYIPRKYSPSGEYKHKETSTTHLCTCANAAIPISNCLGIGYWDITEPQHPNFDFNQTPINIDPPEDHHVGGQPVRGADREGGARMRMEVILMKRILHSTCFSRTQFRQIILYMYAKGGVL